MEEGSERVTFEKGKEKFEKRARRGVVSSVWSHFDVVSVDGEQSAFVCCVHCSALLKWSSSMGTSGLRKHAMACGSFAIKAAVTDAHSRAGRAMASKSMTSKFMASKSMAGSVTVGKVTTSKAGGTLTGSVAVSRVAEVIKVDRTVGYEDTAAYSDNEDTIYSLPSPPTRPHSPLVLCGGALALQRTSSQPQGNAYHRRYSLFTSLQLLLFRNLLVIKKSTISLLLY